MIQTGLYVDVENLMEDARSAINALFEQWPGELDRPDMLRLYVRADQTELWRLWATDKNFVPDVQVVGIQHYTAAGSKNSADIHLALDSFADIIKGRVARVAIFSDDSDFVTLFVKIKQELSGINNRQPSFMWFQTDRRDTRSSVLDEFMPPSQIKIVTLSNKKVIVPRKTPVPSAKFVDNNSLEFAEAIIKNIPVRSFKSTECMKIIQKLFPDHPITRLNPASFGIQFTKTILPVLEGRGVRIANPGKSPRKYLMTEEAKRSVAA
jgi:hypothetical protein